MNKIPLSKSFAANTVTALNISSGFLSIVFASEGNFKMAAIMIIAAAIFDTLDGIVARLLNTASKFGVELDSLSDVVSFGAAPSFLVYKAYAYQFGVWGIFFSSLILIFGALRLARFNTMLSNIKTKGDFTGLPIPLSAITIATLVLSYHENGSMLEPYNKIFLPMVILLSILMVSKIRYNALPKLKNKNFKEKLLLFVTLIIALLLAIITNGEILFYIFLAIVLFGIFRHAYKLLHGKKLDTKNEIKTSES
ncbi:MAG: CDP-diacylglycerol--serine O-phosphatidyltransferase [Ignavibacteriales bacterium]|nr:CDP-diacylglycerol--serine O-phosphatidyltransferase [Ignavibacteriales bacterium]